MSAFFKQLKYELLLFLRQPIYILLIIIFPPIMLVIFGSMYGSTTYNGASFFQKYLPAYIFSMSLSIIMFSVGLEGVEKKEQGIMKMLKTKPYSYASYILTQIIKSVIVATFGFFELLLIAIFLYDVDVSNVNLFFNYCVFIIILIINSYIFISLFSVFKKFKVALMVSLIIYQVMMFLSDFTIPVSQLPSALKKVAEVNPFYHLNHIFISSWNNQIFNDFTIKSLISISTIVIISSIVSIISLRIRDE